MSQVRAQSRFLWTLLVLQVVFAVLYLLLVRYNPSADAKNVENQLHGGKNSEELEKNLRKYPMIIDVHMMLIGGFGFLMNFLRRYGFSAAGFTLLIATTVTQWSILISGFLKMGPDLTISIGFLEILEGGLTAATVLISVGAVLGKLNPLQLLVMALVETPLFVFNAHIGYSVLGVIDIGGAIFIHVFGAYFGLAVSYISRRRQLSSSEHLESSRYTSDLFAMLGTILLWVFWPSFNALLAEGDAFHRAVINTYLSLVGSTLATFIVSSFFGNQKRLEMPDIQNATLSGGVAVGAIADLMLQPYGAFIIGLCTGTISCLGFRKIQGLLHQKFKLHDSCGVNNLHGMPGLISALLSVLMCLLASEEIYGPSLYLIFPRVAPSDLSVLDKLQEELPSIEQGEGRTLAMQAVYQLLILGITVVVAVVMGLITGLILNVNSLFYPLRDHQLFNDEHYWQLPDEELPGDEDKSDEFDDVNKGSAKLSTVVPDQ